MVAWDVWRETYVWDYFAPDYICPDAERVGRLGDGGKWICGVDGIGRSGRGGQEDEGGVGGEGEGGAGTRSENGSENEGRRQGESEGEGEGESGGGRRLDRAPCLVYSFGVRQDVSFERELHRRTWAGVVPGSVVWCGVGREGSTRGGEPTPPSTADGCHGLRAAP